MSALVLIQQRLGSSRLPGKANELIGTYTLTEHVVARACSVVPSSDVILCYPASDDLRSDICRTYAHAGDENDVLGRMYWAVQDWCHDNQKDPTVVVRLTGDCPFVPVSGIRAVIDAVEQGADYAETRSDPSARPNGIDAQAFTHGILSFAYHTCWHHEDREHITPAVKRLARRHEHIKVLEGLSLDGLPPFRLTVDTAEDLEAARSIHEGADELGLASIWRLYQKEPWRFAMDTR